MKRAFYLKSVILFAASFSLLVFAFQNCSKTSFSQKSPLSNTAVAANCVSNPTAAGCASVQQPKCTFNGVTYSEGESVTAYLASNDQACVSQQRVCKSGSFSGSYAYGSCVSNAPASCMFDGRTIVSGSSVQAFQNPTVPYGLTCVSEMRNCKNGILSGMYFYGACSPGAPAACLFNGQTVAHNSSVVAYVNSSELPGQPCTGIVRECKNGMLSGSGNYASCTPGPKACLFNNQTIANNASVVAYQQMSVPYGSVCQSESRNCKDGSLTGSFRNSGCTVGAAAPCNFNDQVIASGQIVKAFPSSTVPYGQQCVSQDRLCTNGILSGSAINSFPSCNPGAAASCSIDGRTVAHNEIVVSYSSQSVTYGNTCSSLSRKCDNGTLSGDTNYKYLSCTPVAPASCTLNGKNIANGESITTYKTASVNSPQACESQSRVCRNGVLDGTYTELSCLTCKKTCPAYTATPATCEQYGKVSGQGDPVCDNAKSYWITYPPEYFGGATDCRYGAQIYFIGPNGWTELESVTLRNAVMQCN
jgi:hypothetical protein